MAEDKDGDDFLDDGVQLHEHPEWQSLDDISLILRVNRGKWWLPLSRRYELRLDEYAEEKLTSVNFRKGLADYFLNNASIAPSEAAKVENFRDTQARVETMIFCGRPTLPSGQSLLHSYALNFPNSWLTLTPVHPQPRILDFSTNSVRTCQIYLMTNSTGMSGSLMLWKNTVSATSTEDTLGTTHVMAGWRYLSVRPAGTPSIVSSKSKTRFQM